ncbi:MAG: metallophosphatase [Armatimonadetes bacterium]|nr:metallophosphatase [Armatimonadota bacterium]
MATAELIILHTNDLHNSWGDSLGEEIRRNGHHLLVDSGDAIAGSNSVFRMREPILDTMSAAGYAAMAVGNREFHYFREVLARRASQVNFPFLSANIVDLSGASTNILKPYAQLDVNGVRLSLIGLTVPQYAENSSWTWLTKFKFLDPFRTAFSLARKLRENTDLLIVLSHLGYRDDLRLAKEVPELDLIIGGHSHTVLESPVRVNGATIVQAGARGRYLGRIEVLVNEKGNPGRILDIQGRLIPVRGSESRSSRSRKSKW